MMVNTQFDVNSYANMVRQYYQDTVKTRVREDGKRVEVEFNRVWTIDEASGKFIFDLIRAIKPQQTLEVGLAQGASALHFLAGLTLNQKGRHTAMDPFQAGFNNIGLSEIARFGLSDRLRFIGERSDVVLPRLRDQNETFQICLIDGDHRFDAVFVDFYHIDKILDVGGIIIFDEAHSKPTEKVISFIRNNLKNYQFLEETPRRFHVLQKTGPDQRDWTDIFDF